MDTKFLENGVAVWMIEFWFEQLDGLQFVGSEFSLFCNIAEWTNEILIEILSGMPNPQCEGVNATFQLTVYLRMRDCSRYNGEWMVDTTWVGRGQVVIWHKFGWECGIGQN